MILEPLAPADVPELVEMCRAGHQESRYRGLKFSPGKVARTFRHAISGDHALAVKCSHGGRVAGFFVGAESDMEFSDDPIGVETSFLVRPEHRGSRCALLLVWAFLDWCEARGLPCFIAVHYGQDNDKAYRFIQRMGLSEIGRIFAKDL